MKIRMSRQKAMKGLLLLALAANVSWDPALKSFMESDYASSANADTGSGTGAASKPVENDHKLSQSPNGVTASDSGVKPDAAAKPQTADPAIKVEEAPKPTVQRPAAEKAPEKPAEKTAVVTPAQVGPLDLKTCESKSHVVYFQEKRDSENRVKTVATVYETFARADDDKAVIARSAPGSMSQWVDNKANRERFEAELKKNLQDTLGDACKGSIAKAEDQKEEQKAANEEKARIAEGMKACTMDAKGNDLREIDQINCHLKQLNKIVVSEKNGSESRRQAMSEIERIVNGPLKKHLKARLLSKDESKVDEGTDLVDEVIDTVEAVAASNELDKRRTEKVINGLKAMKEGSRFNRQTNEYVEKAKNLKEDYRSAWKDYEEAYQLTKTDPWLKNNPALAMQMLQNAATPINSLYMQHSMLSNQVDQTLALGYRNLLAYQSNGAMTALDMRDYITPFRNLRQDLTAMINPKSMGFSGIGITPDNPFATTSGFGRDSSLLGGASILPTDFASIRGGSSQAFRRSYGVGLPQRSGVNSSMGNYGLMSARTNPALPSPVFNSSSINIRPTTGYGGRSTTFGL